MGCMVKLLMDDSTAHTPRISIHFIATGDMRIEQTAVLISKFTRQPNHVCVVVSAQHDD